MFYKVIKILSIINLLSIQTFIAYSDIIDNNYNLFIKFPLIPKTHILSMKSQFEEEKDVYKYSFLIESTPLTRVISKIEGNGYVYGTVNKDIYTPNEYSYKYFRNNKDKLYNIFFKNNKVSKNIVNPDYDKNKLTKIVNSMLNNVIDPASMFIHLDTLADGLCKNNISVFDGKRRYDLDITTSEEGGDYIICRAEQIKIGGYKKNEIDLITQPQIIFLTYKKSNEIFTLKSIEGKNKMTTIIIEKN